ncbi:MAG: hypothetical protein AAFY15_11625, partial [Cyanobacteria bacterium J06648_11]
KYADAAAIALSQTLTSDFCTAASTGTSCILGGPLWDASTTLSDKRGLGLVLKIIFGYREKIYLVQAIAYVIFWLTVGRAYLQSAGITSAPADSSSQVASRSES